MIAFAKGTIEGDATLEGGATMYDQDKDGSFLSISTQDSYFSFELDKNQWPKMCLYYNHKGIELHSHHMTGLIDEIEVIHWRFLIDRAKHQDDKNHDQELLSMYEQWGNSVMQYLTSRNQVRLSNLLKGKKTGHEQSKVSEGIRILPNARMVHTRNIK